MSATFLTALNQLLPKGACLTATEDLKPYECDGLSVYRSLPLAVCLPADEACLIAILKLCHAHNIPIVPRGAGTGLSAGALPIESGIVVSTAKMSRIVKIDVATATAVVQPGVRNLAISEAVAHLGLYYAPDPSSQIACSIGGNVAENSGGVHCLKYGLTVHNIRKLRVVLITGEVVRASTALVLI
jgi:glycolate oxidase